MAIEMSADSTAKAHQHCPQQPGKIFLSICSRILMNFLLMQLSLGRFIFCFINKKMTFSGSFYRTFFARLFLQ